MRIKNVLQHAGTSPEPLLRIKNTMKKLIITSRFNYIRTHLVVLFNFCLFTALGLFMILYISQQVLPEKSSIPVYIFGFFSLFMGLYAIYVYLKQVPVIRLDHRSIKLSSLIKQEEIYWNDIKRVKTTGKASFKYLLPYPMEALTIYLNSGKKVVIFDEYYSNLFLIKQYISNYHKTKVFPEPILEKRIRYVDIKFEKFISVKGNAIFSFRGVIIWGVLLFFAFILIVKSANIEKAIVPLSIIGSIWYLFNGYLCHYFKLSDKYLVICNHYLPWISKKYCNEDIKEVVFESRHNMPNYLRVITHSFKTKLYPAGTLKDSDWKSIIPHMKKNGIKVRNESIK